MSSLPLRPVLFVCAVAALVALVSPLAAQAPAFQPDGHPDPDFPMPAELDLDYALAFALDNNFGIRAAQERIRQQDGVVLEITAQRIPTVTGAGQFTRNDPTLSGASFGGSDRGWNFSVTARQIVYAGGGVTAGIRAQHAALEAAELALRAVIHDALLDVRTRFYTVLLTRETIKVREQNTELLARQLQDVKNRYAAGTVSNFEVLRAEVSLANAQPPLITARNNYRLAIEELRRALGYTGTPTENPGQVPVFNGELGFAPTSFDLASALASARAHRPELLRLDQLETVAEENVKVRQAFRYPTLAIFGAYAGRKSPASIAFSDTLYGWTAGVDLSWSIFDGRATTGRVAQARSLLAQATLSAAEARLIVDVDVRRSISTLQQSVELAEASQKVVAQAEEALRLAEARFGAGTATQLDVLTSQVELTTARLNQLQAYYSYNVAVANVRRDMGLADELKPAGAPPAPAK